MEQQNTNLFRRHDTFFGICEAVGQDFGFNPLYLRLAFIAPLFFFPVQTFAAYFALGAIVLASRLLFPNKAATQAAPVTAEPVAMIEDKTDEYALAA
jgi:phage shock protein C